MDATAKAGSADVRDNVREQLNVIFRRHRVALAYVFGSMVEPVRRFLAGETLQLADPLADIDIGVVLEDYHDLTQPSARAFRYADLFNDLTDVFPEDRLDLTLLQENHSVFQARAMASGLCIYAVSEEFRLTYQERVLARAADFRPVLERYYKERLGGILR